MALGPEAQGQVVLFDDFNGTGNIDWETWRIPFGGNSSFLGRTQLKLDEATETPQQIDGSAVLNLDTFSASDPGNVFSGQEFISRTQFARGGGLTVEYRARLNPDSLITGVGGAVSGMFLFDVTRDDGAGSDPIGLVRDEIDAAELLTNEVVSGQHRLLTNSFDDAPFTGPGSGGAGEFVAPVGLDLTQFNDYRIDWKADSVDYYVNNTLVRSETSIVPNEPMTIRANIWAPDDGFGSAFDADLTPAATAGDNQTIQSEVDFIRVTRNNTTQGPNLLDNAGFETGDFTSWNTFGSAFVEPGSNINDFVVEEGTHVAKLFGPNTGRSDASGFNQAVPAQPGQEFEAVIRAINDTDANGGVDNLDGTNNFGELAIEFLDASGVLLPSPLGDEFFGENERNTSVIDGRSPNIINDEYLTARVNAIAPAGAAFAQINLLFVQVIDDAGGPDGGALYYDSAELYLLEAVTVDGDFDGDLDVDGADFLSWQRDRGDADSLALWQDGFGNGTLAVAAINAVPEPSSVLLIVAAMVSLSGVRRKYSS